MEVYRVFKRMKHLHTLSSARFAYLLALDYFPTFFGKPISEASLFVYGLKVRTVELLLECFAVFRVVILLRRTSFNIQS